jgi:sterol desaturase/sphingolipid hydroxylase (fatty acid hydroxylase superfamily)
MASIWDRINGTARKQKLDKAEKDAVMPKKKAQPKKAKPKKSVEQTVSDDFWSS